MLLEPRGVEDVSRSVDRIDPVHSGKEQVGPGPHHQYRKLVVIGEFEEARRHAVGPLLALLLLTMTKRDL
eukprot:230382-Heterocapsa_arctica.AAC.1